MLMARKGVSNKEQGEEEAGDARLTANLFQGLITNDGLF